MNSIKNFLKKLLENFFNSGIDFRAQIFNLLGLVGAVLGFLTAVISLLTNAWTNLVVNILLTATAAIFLWIANSTKKFESCYLWMIVIVFFVTFPVLFFTAGGYHSAMPCYFVFAIAFTAMMLKGKRRFTITFLEMLLYIGICLFAWRFPQSVTMTFSTERDFAVEIISGFTFVGTALWISVILLMRIYDRKQAQLEQLDKMKTELLGNVSHEMKTPLAVISGYAQILRKELRGLPNMEETVLKSRLIVNEADRLARMISQILDMTRIDEGYMIMTMRETSFSEIIQDTMNLYDLPLNKNGNKIVLNLDENLPVITADATHISRVLINLLSNAVSHTKNGTITVSAKTEGGFVVVSVADTGGGIAEDIRPYLFQRYTSKKYNGGIKKTCAGNDAGTGLGLYICKYIVEAHGGSIALKNEQGSGTCFSFTIPISK